MIEKAGGKITFIEVKPTTPKAEKRLSGEEKKPAADKKAPAEKAPAKKVEAKEPAEKKPAPKKAPAKKEDKE